MGHTFSGANGSGGVNQMSNAEFFRSQQAQYGVKAPAHDTLASVIG